MEQLKKYIEDPLNPTANFELALEYFNSGHKASALSYFHRCAELSDNPLEIYKSLLYCANTLYHQPNRQHSTTGFILHAISVLPERPEAWFLYARSLENAKSWQECYSSCCTALRLCDFHSYPLLELEYPGRFGLLFLKAISSWSIGRREESREILRHLAANENLPPGYKQLIQNNMNFLKMPFWIHTYFDYTKHNLLRFPFEGSQLIERNFSEAYQDLFILAAHEGKRNGTYLEIGAAGPYLGNNTVLLEKQFDWKGISLEIDENLVEEFRSQRSNEIICADATKVNYSEILSEKGFPKDIDYLQLDCDPPNITYEILQRIPFDEYRFGVITYEHDYYNDFTKSYRDLSREFLKSKGYVLAVKGVSTTKDRPYEDWWFHPQLISDSTFRKMLDFDGSDCRKAEEYMLSEIPLSKFVK